MLHDLKIWAEKPLNEYTDIDGRKPLSLEDLAADLITREVEHLSEVFQRYLGIPEDEYNDEIFRTEADFRYSVFNELYKTDFHSKCV